MLKESMWRSVEIRKRALNSTDKSFDDGDFSALFISTNSISNYAWFIDSDASFHRTPHKE